MRDTTLAWIRIGAIAGIVAVVGYSTFFFVPWPLAAAVVVATTFGVTLAIGCVGLRVFLTLERRSVMADIAAGMGVLAGQLVMLMLIVQLAIRYPAIDFGEGTSAFRQGLDRVHFGIDVSWDMLIGGATFLFALAAWRHPRLGATYTVAGVLIAVALVATNLMTFPMPPAGAGSFDVGPFVGLWYLAISLRVLRSLGWAEAVTSAGDPQPPPRIEQPMGV